MSTRPRPAPAPDPLADLRMPEPPAGALPEVPPAPPVLEPLEGPLAAEVTRFDAVWHEDAIAAVQRRWHSDLIATRALHHGGSCPCHRLARIALLEAVGMALEPAPETEDDGGDAH